MLPSRARTYGQATHPRTQRAFKRSLHTQRWHEADWARLGSVHKPRSGLCLLGKRTGPNGRGRGHEETEQDVRNPTPSCRSHAVQALHPQPLLLHPRGGAVPRMDAPQSAEQQPPPMPTARGVQQWWRQTVGGGVVRPMGRGMLATVAGAHPPQGSLLLMRRCATGGQGRGL